MRADVSILLALKAAEQKYSQKMAEKGGLKAVVHSCIHAPAGKRRKNYQCCPRHSDQMS